MSHPAEADEPSRTDSTAQSVAPGVPDVMSLAGEVYELRRVIVKHFCEGGKFCAGGDPMSIEVHAPLCPARFMMQKARKDALKGMRK